MSRNFIKIYDSHNNVVAQEITILNQKLNSNFKKFSAFVFINNHTEQIDVWASNLHYASTCINKICKSLYKNSNYIITSIN